MQDNVIELKKEKAKRAAIPSDDEEKKNFAQILAEIAEKAKLFHDPKSEVAYGIVTIDGHQENLPIRQGSFRQWLRQEFYKQEGRGIGGQVFQDCIETLEARAFFEGKAEEVFLRVAGHDGKIYVDLCNEKWQVIEIDENGWRVLDNSPVKFRRTKGQAELPLPKKGGEINDLKHFLNYESDDDFKMIASWLIGSFHPFGPYPILALQGGEGTAKSTTARVLKSLIDPNTVPLRPPSRTDRDLAIEANSSWVLAFDNVSGLPVWLSDMLCRISTGGGFVTRTLFRDEDLTMFKFKRPLVVTGIGDVITRNDLLDRSIVINLPKLTTVREEKHFWEEFDDAKPMIFGAILAAISAGLRNEGKANIEHLPRMADFASWVIACEEGLGWDSRAFLQAYTEKRAEAIDLALEADAVAVAIRTMLSARGKWIGTAGELLEALDNDLYISERTRRSKRWPKNPRTLSNRLTRATNFLSQVGIEVDRIREAGTGRRLIMIQALEKD